MNRLITTKKANILFSFFILLSGILLWGCRNKSESIETTKLSDFEYTGNLEGKPVEMDTLCGLPGNVKVIGNNYVFYLYDSDHTYSVTDNRFKLKTLLAKKGTGPDETAGLWADGQRAGDSGFYAFEPTTSRLKKIDVSDSPNIETVADFSSLPDSIRPISALKLPDDRYVFVKNNMMPGLVIYDLKSGKAKELPTGIEIENPNLPNPFIASMHVLSYNEKNGLFGEIYDSMPLLILRDKDGNIVRKIQYGDVPSPADVEKAKMSGKFDFSQFYNPMLKDSAIYISYKKAGEKQNHCLIVGYDGKGIADLLMPFGIYFDIDIESRKIIAVDPNEEPYMMVYDLPEGIKL